MSRSDIIIDELNLSLTRKIFKWLLWKPLYVLSRYAVVPSITWLYDALQNAHSFIVRKSTEGEMPF